MDALIMPPNFEHEFAYSVTQFCRALGISRTTFYKLVKERVIRTLSIGKRRLVPSSELTRLLENTDTEYRAAITSDVDGVRS